MRQVRLAAGVAAGALATLDVVTGAITPAVTASTRIISTNFTYAWEDVAAVIDDGCEFGLAHSDYSAAEIEECLEAQSAMDLGDKIAQEQGNRLVRSIGKFASNANAGSGVVFNEGRPWKTRLNWMLSIGDTLNLWIRNGSAVIWTTGSTVGIQGHVFVSP